MVSTKNIQHIIRFISILIIQILMFQSNTLFIDLHPVIYLLFPLTLSPTENKSYVLITSFLLGVLVDVFYNTLGLHASAILLVVLLRSVGLRLIRVKSLDLNEEITVNKIPFPTFFIYITLFTFIHQLYIIFLSNIEFWSLQDLKYIFINTLVSSVIMLMLHIIFVPRKK